MIASVGWGHYFAGCACYLQNDLSGAYEHFGVLVKSRYRFAALTAAHGAFGLALTFQALDLPTQANAVLEDAQQYLKQLRGRHLFKLSEALAAELAMRQGRLEEAARWRRPQGGNLPADALLLLYSAQLALAKILLAEDTVASRREARHVLTEFLDWVTKLHHVRFQIEAQVWLAQLFDREQDSIAAHAALEQALALAAPGGHMRVFLDAAPALGPLLAAYQPPAAVAAFAARVRSAVEQAAEHPLPITLPTAQNGARQSLNRAAGPLAPVLAAPNPSGRELRELLTFREMDVLMLLRRRMTNKEIARELGISVDTVKQHSVNLYRKLGVENRRQAILYAEAAGLDHGVVFG